MVEGIPVDTFAIIDKKLTKNHSFSNITETNSHHPFFFSVMIQSLSRNLEFYYVAPPLNCIPYLFILYFNLTYTKKYSVLHENSVEKTCHAN